MKWLTQEERTNLEPAERRALRRQRRAAHRDEGGGWFRRLNLRRYLNLDQFKELAEDLILELVEDALPWDEGRVRVLDEVCSHADELFDFSLVPYVGLPLEAFDGMIARALLGPMLDELYEAMAARAAEGGADAGADAGADGSETVVDS